jgi:hypothetical protein
MFRHRMLYNTDVCLTAKEQQWVTTSPSLMSQRTANTIPHDVWILSCRPIRQNNVLWSISAAVLKYSSATFPREPGSYCTVSSKASNFCNLQYPFPLPVTRMPVCLRCGWSESAAAYAADSSDGSSKFQ